MNRHAPKIWLALLVVPVVALGYQTLAYALVPRACAAQTAVPLHMLSAVVMFACLACTLMAAREWHRLARTGGASLDDDAADAPTRNRFLAAAATFVGALFTLLVATQWMTGWVLSPCLQ